MPNAFDRFDTQPPASKNEFDQFDKPEPKNASKTQGASVTITAENEEGEGLISQALDVAEGAAKGLFQGVITEPGNALASAAESVGLPSTVEVLPEEGGLFKFGYEAEEAHNDPFFNQPFDEPQETTAGNITRGVTQFVGAYAGIGKMLKPFGLAAGQASTTLGTAGRAMAQGAAADVVAFDPHEERLSNLLNEFPELQNPVTDYLAATPEDTEAEGRFKNALEGVIAGGVVEGLLRTLRVFKRAKGTKTPDKVLAENSEELEAVAKQAETASTPKPEPTGEALNAKTTAKPTPKQTGPSVDVEAFRAHVAKEGLGLGDDAALPGGRLFNTDRMDSPEAVQSLIRKTAPLLKDEIGKRITAGVLTLEEMQAQASKTLADMLDDDAGNLISRLSDRSASAEDMIAEMLAGKQLLQALASRILKKATEVDLGDTPEARAQLYQLIQQYSDVAAGTKGIQTTFARGTTAGRVRTGSEDLSAVVDMLEGKGADDQMRELAYKLRMAGDSPKAVYRTVRQARGLVEKTSAYWINSILSGPKTHLVNITSNALNTAVQPMERALGAAIGGNKEVLQESLMTYVGLAKFFSDGVRMSAKALRSGRPILDISQKVEHELALPSQESLGAIQRWAGNFLSLPVRFLSTEDEFFKQWNYRANLYGRLWQQGHAKGLRGRNLASYIEDNFDRAFSKSGRGLDQQALRIAQEATFTQPLNKGTFGHSLQSVTRKHPFTRFIVPFVRTPTNIMRNVWARTPGLQFLQTEFRENFKGIHGKQAQAKARGQFAMGVVLWGAAGMAASQGRLTGASPSNHVERQNLEASGWKPYAFVTTDPETGKKVYTQFNRMDPFGMYLGLAADLYTMTSAGLIDDATADELASMAGVALAQNLSNRTYLQGITNVADAFSQPDRRAYAVIKNYVASFVPTGAMQIANLTGIGADPYMREARNVVDAVMARTPGFSDELPPRRNWVTGEPIAPNDGGWLYPDAISPFAQGVESDNPVINELARIGYSAGRPSRTKGNVELTPEQYDKLIRLTAKPQGRVPLEDRLARLFATPRYQRIKDLPFRVTQDVDDPRAAMVDAIVGKYRENAWHLLRREYPQLDADLRNQRRNKGNAARGDLEALRPLLQQQ